MADQNLSMSDEIPTVVGHNVRTIYFAFQCKRLCYNAFCSKRKLVYSALRTRYIKRFVIERYCNMMSDLVFVLSNQNGDLVGQMSFQEKKLFAALRHVYKEHFDHPY